MWMTGHARAMSEATDGPGPWAGVWLAEDVELIAAGVSSGSWIDGSIGAITAGLDALALVSDPVGVLLQYGVAWIIEHVRPLSEALDWLAGDPAAIDAHARSWRTIGATVEDEAVTLERTVRWDTSEWTGAAGDAYREHMAGQVKTLQTLRRAADTMAAMTEAAGAIVATVRTMVRDGLATLVSHLVVYAAEVTATAGLATPVVVEQVATLCAAWSARIARWLKGLIRSLTELGKSMSRLAHDIDQLSALRRTNNTRAEELWHQTGGGIRRPRFDADFDTEWADLIYDRIRATDDELPAIVETARPYGFTPDDITVIKNHVFRDEHLLDMFGEPIVSRFDSSARMAEAWQRLADGTPHPEDIILLRHERYEAEYMRNTGDPSYDRAHAATLAAGLAWDPEAAARDGLGYQRKDRR
jgi:uncharacterized protein YukE